MLDNKLFQSIGNVAVRTIEYKYPSVEIHFFALRGGAESRIHIAARGNQSGRTGRLYDLDPVPTSDTPLVKDIAGALEKQIERHVREFLQSTEETPRPADLQE